MIDWHAIPQIKDRISVCKMFTKWDVRAHDARLAGTMFEGIPLLDPIYSTITAALPYLRTCKPIEAAPFVRPEGHGRSFYIDLEKIGEQMGREHTGAGVVAVKGSELASEDYLSWMRQLRRRKEYFGINAGDALSSRRTDLDTTLNGLDRWPILERRFPGGITVPEVSRQAAIAQKLQSAYLRRYGQFARIPLPLAVYQWPTHITDSAWSAVEPLLSERASEICRGFLADGLGVYAYYYPCLPIRLRSLDGEPPNPRYSTRLEHHVAGRADAKRLISEWHTLFVRLLLLGYVPKDPGGLLSSDCLQRRNVTLDGGFVDVDNIVPLADLDSWSINDSIRRSLRSLATNVGFLLLGKVAASVEFRDRFPELIYLVIDDIAHRLRREAEGIQMTSGIPSYLTHGDLYDSLTDLFRTATGKTAFA